MRLVLAACAVLIVAAAFRPADDLFFAIKKNLTIFGALYEELAVGYVDDVDPEQMMRAGIDSMMETLDPYTVFIDEADNVEIDIMTSGRYGGVGINVIQREDGRLVVGAVVEGYSAFRQGVRAGDLILQISGRNTTGMDLSDLGLLLNGEPGTTVPVRIDREGEPEPLEFVLTRSEVRVKDVPYAGLLPNDAGKRIGYVKLERFSRTATGEVRQALTQLQKDDNLDSIILDLRDNPGGLLGAAVDITGLFVPQGSAVVSTKGRLPQTERTYRSQRPPLVPDAPLVVLVNGVSASASEIVAGAVQDLDRGVILGETSFGKGLVQIVRPLPYNTSLKMTTSKYYTPSGRSIQSITYTHSAADGYAVEVPDSLRSQFQTAGGRLVRDGGGIEPDVPVQRPQLSALEQALLRKAAYFQFANTYAARRDSLPETFEVGDDVLGAFEAWLDAESFSYRTTTERMIDALGREVADAGYTETTDEFAALRMEVAREKNRDFERHDTEIREALRAEILARFHGEQAQIRASLRHDTQVRAALDLLLNGERYGTILE
ncbi:MAG: S41 family peptidase [Bacteroidota bacterium]